MIHETKISNLGILNVPDPEYGDFKLNLFPFINNQQRVKLPVGYELWEDTIESIVKMIPLQNGANQHYITIDSKFFSKSETLRREGVHADGNFCVDPNFKSATWGGTTTTWGGSKYHPKLIVVKDWVMPYDIEFPVGEYISADKGGLICVSSYVGCQAWQGEFYGEIESEGSFHNMIDQLTDDKKVVFEADQLFAMSSNTPHESLIIEQGIRRTFIRITLNHEYLNQVIFKYKYMLK
jgi:hypothetical protein